MPEKPSAFQQLLNNRTINLATFILVPILIVIILLLPPISLIERLSGVGYQTVGIDGTTIESDGGVQITVPPGSAGKSWLKSTQPPALKWPTRCQLICP
jgi:hypothetical protein